jgi:hypothetical protein
MADMADMADICGWAVADSADFRGGMGDVTGSGVNCPGNFRRFRRNFAQVQAPELPIWPILAIGESRELLIWRLGTCRFGRNARLDARSEIGSKGNFRPEGRG